LRFPRIAQVVGCGSATTSSSSFSTASAAGGMRVMLLAAWPNTSIARRLSGWSTWSLGRTVASNQRVSGMPGVSIIFLEAKRDCIQS
jgi:hypothetical protein